ncbi:hypothetical protein NXV33_22485 [Bacteroides thetaiotaomicron]|nr:hypothetical protein [Bacteroides thetaiotaomicron]UVV53174.1 hypothetical protein NXY15_28990 [Bacteroides thetaiotaomicron]
MTNTNHFNEQVTGYDKHGNITGLKRYGQTGQSSYGLIDDLSLTYTGNQAQESDRQRHKFSIREWFRVQGRCESGHGIFLRRRR